MKLWLLWGMLLCISELPAQIEPSSALPSLIDKGFRAVLAQTLLTYKQNNKLNELPLAFFRCNEALLLGHDFSQEDVVEVGTYLANFFSKEAMRSDGGSGLNRATVGVPLFRTAELAQHHSMFPYTEILRRLDQILHAVTGPEQELIEVDAHTRDRRKSTVFHMVEEAIASIWDSREEMGRELEDKIEEVIAGLMKSQKSIQRSVSDLAESTDKVEKELIDAIDDLKQSTRHIEERLHLALDKLAAVSVPGA